MKIRSKQLLKFLIDRDAFSLPPENLMALKSEYRRLYKRDWKKNRQIPKRDLRPGLTLAEYGQFRQTALKAGFKNPTSFTRELILSSITSKPFIPERDRLLQISQRLGVAINTLSNSNVYIDKPRILELLVNAEDLLMIYLSKN